MFGYYFDPMYFLFVGPAMLLALWAQFKVKSTFAAAAQTPVASGLDGAEAARLILDANNLQHVQIEEHEGMLSDHYDPREKVLRLSTEVYHGRNMAAVGVAAHEAGHALQDAQRYPLLAMRNGLVPLANTGGMLSGLLIMAGMVLMVMTHGARTGGLGYTLMLAGVAAFGLTVIFQLVNLPVEFDASRRAKLVLNELHIVRDTEMQPIASVLSAAAMTYVAATLTAIMTLLYYLWRLGLLGGDRR
jgi:hypothetical protein